MLNDNREWERKMRKEEGRVGTELLHRVSLSGQKYYSNVSKIFY